MCFTMCLAHMVFGKKTLLKNAANRNPDTTLFESYRRREKNARFFCHFTRPFLYCHSSALGWFYVVERLIYCPSRLLLFVVRSFKFPAVGSVFANRSRSFLAGPHSLGDMRKGRPLQRGSTIRGGIARLDCCLPIVWRRQAYLHLTASPPS